MFDKRDPYYVDDDVFASVENTERNVQRLRDLDYRKPLPENFSNSGLNCMANMTTLIVADFKKWAKNTTYLSGVDNKVHELRPSTEYYKDTGEQVPIYSTKAFHQMHCIVSLFSLISLKDLKQMLEYKY